MEIRKMICKGMLELLPEGLISMVRYHIECTEKDLEDGRTHFIEYWIRGVDVTILHGFRFNSEDDKESMERINKIMREVQKESIRKQICSQESGRKVIMNR